MTTRIMIVNLGDKVVQIQAGAYKKDLWPRRYGEEYVYDEREVKIVEKKDSDGEVKQP